MNGGAGVGAFGAGAIFVAVETADERVCSVRLRSSRPTNLSRLFRGRPADEIPVLAERLHALCGAAHGHAAVSAIGAARGESPQPSAAGLLRLLCERIGEILRSSAAMAGETAPAPLRELLSLTRAIAHEPALAGADLDTRLRAAADQLGLVETPPAGSLFGELWRACVHDAALAAEPPDALGAEDDAAVLAALRREGERFAAAPRLSGRAPETGAFARHWRDTDLSRGALPARLQARMIDLAQALGRLACGVEEGPARCASPAVREGFAAVETARGELYHWARLTHDDKIADYAIVAPTEWNFHPAGPFVATLLGARLPRGDAQATIARLAALFDPCVAFRVEVTEAAHA